MKFHHHEKPRCPLAKWRAKNNVTQGAVAFKLAISRTMISMIENGARQPSLKTIAKIADLTNQEVSGDDWDLFFRRWINTVIAEEHAQSDYRTRAGKTVREEMENELSSNEE